MLEQTLWAALLGPILDIWPKKKAMECLTDGVRGLQDEIGYTKSPKACR